MAKVSKRHAKAKVMKNQEVDMSPLFPAGKEIQEIADQVKFTLEQKVSEMFPMYKALTYRVSPFVLPPSLDSCYHIKVETIAEKQCYHIVVHVVTEGGRTTFTLVAYQPEVDLHAPLGMLHVLGERGVKF